MLESGKPDEISKAVTALKNKLPSGECIFVLNCTLLGKQTTGSACHNF